MQNAIQFSHMGEDSSTFVQDTKIVKLGSKTTSKLHIRHIYLHPCEYELIIKQLAIIKSKYQLTNLCAVPSVLGAISPEEAEARLYTTPTMFSWPVLCGSSLSRA